MDFSRNRLKALEAGVRIWDPVNECMSREELEVLQFTRLRATLDRVIDNVPCYRNKFQQAGIVAA